MKIRIKALATFVITLTSLSAIADETGMNAIWNFPDPSATTAALQMESLYQQKAGGLLKAQPSNGTGSSFVSPISGGGENGGQGSLLDQGGNIAIGNFTINNVTTNQNGNDNVAKANTNPSNTGNQGALGATLNGGISGSGKVVIPNANSQ